MNAYILMITYTMYVQILAVHILHILWCLEIVYKHNYNTYLVWYTTSITTYKFY
jgi:hypothetical protein